MLFIPKSPRGGVENLEENIPDMGSFHEVIRWKLLDIIY